MVQYDASELRDGGSVDKAWRWQVQEAVKWLSRWHDQAVAIASLETEARRAGDRAAVALRGKLVGVRDSDGVAWRVLPLRVADEPLLSDVAWGAKVLKLPESHRPFLRIWKEVLSPAASEVQPLLGLGRIFAAPGTRSRAKKAGNLLIEYQRGALEEEIPTILSRLKSEAGTGPEVVTTMALEPWTGLPAAINPWDEPLMLVPGQELDDLPENLGILRNLQWREDDLKRAAVKAGNDIRQQETQKLLAEMPVERLKEATRDRLKFAPLTNQGIAKVADVLVRGHGLERLPGIGSQTATRIRGAAQTIRQTTFDEMPVRIDIKNRSGLFTELLRRLSQWDAVRRAQNLGVLQGQIELLAPLAAAMPADVRQAVVSSVSGKPAQDLVNLVQEVRRQSRRVQKSSPGSGDPWDDFLKRPADYYAMLSELGFQLEDESKTHGDLPAAIIEAVRAFELDTTYLSASLRGYQSFAARFALVQRKVIIGDEMGLGKTVEALAVLAHLRTKGARHALVICPAAVVTNWIRETGSKSDLKPHRLHGSGRSQAAKSWLRQGGVAVTTFDTLKWLDSEIAMPSDLGCVIVDEAHYVKNRGAQRSARTARLLGSCDRAVLLTGTPLENRLDEFATLVGYLRPDLVVDTNDLAPRRFRRQVAPAYLRRNQEDVGTEVPDMVEVQELLPFSVADQDAYRVAVWERNFMAMRQVAMLQGRDSAKMGRLLELVAEAEANHRRVIVFSHFRAVLDQVAELLPGKVFGPLTGAVPAAARQRMVDDFSAASNGAVLVSQIVAGGVGLNIQAASVVVICEPQLKPTTEWQAIARARRMGQLKSVQVHRLLTEVGVDQRISEILAMKRGLFDQFARVSDTAESAPEAVDISEAELAREVIESERERLFSGAVDGVRH